MKWPSGRTFAIAVGGALGASARWAMLGAGGTQVPLGWRLLAINVAGSFVVGIAMAQEWTHPRNRTLLHAGVGVGFCGGLTTFSTLALEVGEAFMSGSWVSGTTYVVASVAASIGAAIAGVALFRRLSPSSVSTKRTP